MVMEKTLVMYRIEENGEIEKHFGYLQTTQIPCRHFLTWKERRNVEWPENEELLLPLGKQTNGQFIAY